MIKFRKFIKEYAVVVPKAKDTLGVTRNSMPQVDSKDHADLIRYLSKNGIKTKVKTVKAKTLKATQKNFNKDKVEKAAQNYATLHTAKPILVSSDNFIIDGHHRWLGALNVGGDIKIIQADTKIDELLSIIHEYPKSYTKNINESEER